MPIVDLKKQLHEVIDAIEDEQVLTTLLLIMSPKEANMREMNLNDSQVKELEAREKRFDSGESKALPLALFKIHMRNKYGI
jgi:hypothetical protein